MNITTFIIYLIIINIITFIVFGLDKLFAIKKMSRVRNITLLSLVFIGGEIGAIIAMRMFHHKTKQYAYTVGIPLILLIHVSILIYIEFIMV